jgi:hypothetical protein
LAPLDYFQADHIARGDLKEDLKEGNSITEGCFIAPFKKEEVESCRNCD